MLFYASVSCILIFCTSDDLIKVILKKPDDLTKAVDYRLAYFIVTAFMLACIFGAIITGFFTFHIWLVVN